MGNLQFGLLASHRRVILAPDELERFARLKRQQHECAALSGLLLILALTFPIARKSRDPGV